MMRMSARTSANGLLLRSWSACVEFVDDRGHRDAAQIAFFAVLSFVPLAMLLVGGFGLFFDDEEIRGGSWWRSSTTCRYRRTPTASGWSAPWATRSTTRAGSGRSASCC